MVAPALIPRPRRALRGRQALAAALVVSGALAACGDTAATGPSGTAGAAGAPVGRHLAVIAGENFWGSIAAQIAGRGATVLSVVSDPNTDPHEYETSTDDAKAFANADYVVINGAGYDRWAEKLLAANARDARVVLNVADLLGRRQGDNPHFWYSPSDVTRVADRIVSDLTALDPQDAASFTAQRSGLDLALDPYRARIAAIKTRFAGTPVAATETIVQYLTDALGLNLVSPVALMSAVAEGNDPPAAAVAQLQQQLQQRQVKLLLYNAQTVTPVTTNLRQVAAEHGIPAVAVTETVPAGACFQDWQVAQLDAILAALGGGTATGAGPPATP